MGNSVFLLVLGILLLILPFVLRTLRWRMSFSSVIRTFRQNNAVGAKNAKTADDLELKLEDKTPSLLRTGDTKSDAVRVLRNVGIIRNTEDGKLYLAEESLSASKYSKYDKKEVKAD